MSETLKLRVIVEESDIQNGARGNPWECPIARAVDRLTELTPNVDTERIVLCSYREGREIWCADTPQMAMDFIEDFDGENAVDLIDFQVEFKRCGGYEDDPVR